ncbi:hypothetical protein [Micromonospora arborensis]|uniref:hypothetical protein n=1 Tax=Micromonospora arborensis TaxID=2116518 RepID=UPI0011B81B47|nr:hypothetical protein [Micromonospora arborensis]
MLAAAEVPKITDWMQAWGSLIGIAVSSLAVIITGMLLRHEMRMRREEKADAEAAQARLISVTWSGVEEGDGSDKVIQWQVFNHSQAPIREVLLEVDEGRTREEPTVVAVINYIGPGESESGAADLEKAVASGYGLRPVVSTIFTDGCGIRWARRERGQPVKIRGPLRPAETPFSRVLWLYCWPVSAPPYRLSRWFRNRTSRIKFRMEMSIRMRTIRQRKKMDLAEQRKASAANSMTER